VLRTDFILDGMLSIGIIGLTIDRVIRYSAKKLMPWSRALNA
jgi:NitT/TauT family transport system permease protein/taurine transport system permease protein